MALRDIPRPSGNITVKGCAENRMGHFQWPWRIMLDLFLTELIFEYEYFEKYYASGLRKKVIGVSTRSNIFLIALIYVDWCEQRISASGRKVVTQSNNCTPNFYVA